MVAIEKALRMRGGSLVRAAALGAVFWSGTAMAGDTSGVETLRANPDKAVDFVWILLCGFLVMFMQAGFACVESGFCRAKKVTNLLAKNLMDFVVGSGAWNRERRPSEK